MEIIYARVLYIVLIVFGIIAFHIWHKYRYTILRHPKIIFGGWVLAVVSFAALYGFTDAIVGNDVFNEKFYTDKNAFELALQYLYFSFTTASTIGFGELHPEHWVVKVLVIIESAVGLIVGACLAGSIIQMLTRQDAKPLISKIRIVFLENEKTRWFVSFHTYNGAIEITDLSILLRAEGHRLSNTQNPIDGSRGKQYGITSFYFQNMEEMNKFRSLEGPEYYIRCQTTSMSFGHITFVRMKKESVEEICQLLERRSASGATNTPELNYHFSESEALENLIDENGKPPGSQIESVSYER